MPDIIKHKQSAVPAAVPTAGQLEFGELAINTEDGRIYFKKNDGSVVATTMAVDLEGLLPRGLVIDTDTSFSAGITWPTISFGVQRFEPSSPPDQSVRFMGIRRFEYNTPFNNFGVGHSVAGLDWYVQTGLGNPSLAIAHEAKFDNEVAATITTAVGTEGQLSSNAGNINTFVAVRARLTGNAGTVDHFIGTGVDVSGNTGTLTKVTGLDFPDLSALTGTARYAVNNRDPQAPIVSASPVIDQSIAYAAPAVDGFTVAVPDYKQVILVMPSAAYASGTIVMPARALLHDGQSLEVLCTQAVAAVTWGYNGATFVFNAPVAIAAGQVVRLKYYQAIDWWIADGTKEIDTVVGLQAALNAKQATLVSGDTVKTINGSSVLGAGDLVVSAAPAGAPTQVQFNNGGVSAGADKVSIGADGNLLLAENIGQPAPPPSGTIQIYGRNRAGAIWPEFQRSSGREIPVQAHFGVNRAAWWAPSVNTTVSINGIPRTAVGTVSHPVLASTNLSTSCRRWRVSSTTTANAVADERSASTVCWRGNAPGLGGWTYTNRLSIVTLQTACKAFFGISSSVAAFTTTQDPNALTNSIGIGFVQGVDTNWQVFRNDGTGVAVKDDMGASFPVSSLTNVYTLFIDTEPNGSSIWVRVVEEVSGAVFEVEYTTDIPASTVFLSVRNYMNNGGVAAVVAYDCSGVYLETDY
jgi:hypothetical protein